MTTTPAPATSASDHLQALIEAAYADRERLRDPKTRAAVEEAVALLDRGALRVAEKRDGAWQVNAWVKQAILLYLVMRPAEPMEAGALHFHDKVPVKAGLQAAGVRVVPPGTARYGSFLA